MCEATLFAILERRPVAISFSWGTQYMSHTLTLLPSNMSLISMHHVNVESFAACPDLRDWIVCMLLLVHGYERNG